jgi:hypothetical protein
MPTTGRLLTIRSGRGQGGRGIRQRPSAPHEGADRWFCGLCLVCLTKIVTDWIPWIREMPGSLNFRADWQSQIVPPQPTRLSGAMDWQQIAPDFEWDGSLREIYVLETSIAEWQKVWEALRKLEPLPVFSIDSTAQPMPEQVAPLFAIRSQRSPLLSVHVGRNLLNCHFFQCDEIEFDFDPRDVTGPSEAELLAGFMRIVGEVTGKIVILTAENSKEAVIARCLPATGEVIWTAQPLL